MTSLLHPKAKRALLELSSGGLVVGFLFVAGLLAHAWLRLMHILSPCPADRWLVARSLLGLLGLVSEAFFGTVCYYMLKGLVRWLQYVAGVSAPPKELRR